MRLLFLAVSMTAIGAACQKQEPAPPKASEPEEVVIKGEPGCHGGGCPDATTPCKKCGADEWCWCSTCCVALKDRPADWEVRDRAAKEKARALAKSKGLRTDRTL